MKLPLGRMDNGTMGGQICEGKLKGSGRYRNIGFVHQ